MRGDITRKILALVSEGMVATGDIIFAVLNSNYGASRSKMSYAIRKRNNQRIEYKKRQRFYSLMFKLKKEGLLDSENKKWSLTKLGEGKLKIIKNNYQAKKFPKTKYPKEKDDSPKIVIFDIPERYKSKRNWLRSCLVNLNFKLLQKSVWLGKTKIPIAFIKDIKDLGIFSYIHIFSINKSGTITD